MTEQRNTDWTDKLRERLSSSELPPSADIWSKVESAAGSAGSRKVVPAPVWWGAACALAAAALAALFIVPKGGATIDIVPVSSPEVVAQAVPDDEPAPVDEQMPVHVAAPKAAVPSPAASEPVVNQGVHEAFDADENPTESVESAAAEGAVAEIGSDAPVLPAGNDTPKDALTFEDLPAEKSGRKKKAELSLFASGIPGNSSQTSSPDIYYVLQPGPGYSSGNISAELASILNSSSNAAIVVVAGSDMNGTGRNPYWPSQPHATNAVDGIDYYAMLRNEVRHHRPISFGVTLTYPLVRNWFLESGLSYTFLRSEYANNLGDQRLHFLGVPFKLGYRIDGPSNFSLALSAGAMAEKCIYGEVLGGRARIKEAQFSAVATASANYCIGNNLSLFLAPELSYYFTGTTVPTYRTERPLSLTLRLGVNMNLGK